MRERILGDFARVWVQATDKIHLLGRKPHIAVLGNSKRVRRGFGTRQWKFLERFRLRVEAANLAGAKSGKPDNSIRGGLNATRKPCRRGLIACDLMRFRIYLEQLPRGRET